MLKSLPAIIHSSNQHKQLNKMFHDASNSFIIRMVPVFISFLVFVLLSTKTFTHICENMKNLLIKLMRSFLQSIIGIAGFPKTLAEDQTTDV